MGNLIRKPKDPFYMVGRMSGQNVVIRAEKGKVRMMVDEADGHQGKELVYNLNMEKTDNDYKKQIQITQEVHGGREAQGGPSGSALPEDSENREKHIRGHKDPQYRNP